jgi:hypothetical protein
VARAGHGGPDPVDDLVRFLLGNLNELVFQVASFSGNERWAELPDEIPGKGFIAFAASLGVGTPEDTGTSR